MPDVEGVWFELVRNVCFFSFLHRFMFPTTFPNVSPFSPPLSSSLMFSLLVALFYYDPLSFTFLFSFSCLGLHFQALFSLLSSSFHVSYDVFEPFLPRLCSHDSLLLSIMTHCPSLAPLLHQVGLSHRSSLLISLSLHAFPGYLHSFLTFLRLLTTAPSHR